MNSRFVLTIVFGLAAVALLLGAARQRRQLESLRARPVETPATNLAAAAPAATGRGPTTAQLSDAEKIDLMRLRREVGELTRRRRDLAAVGTENDRLKQQLATARTNGVPALPPGYLRSENAKFAGLATPENTLESFFWAVRERDRNALGQILTEEAAAGMMSELTRGGDEEFAKMGRMLVGFRVVERKQETDDTAELKVEIVPGVDPMPIRLKRVGNDWRLSP